MVKIENVQVWGFEGAIRGMRNPKNSWDKDDSYYDNDGYFYAGENNLKLMSALSKAGTDHGKFMRMIHVQCDITGPLYWWKEADTYKVGTVADSCSTMHKIQAKEFTLDDFSVEHLDVEGIEFYKDHIIPYLNWNRNVFNGVYETDEPKKNYWWHMIQMLPSTFNQKRTWDLNYAVLKNIYWARKDHKLDEWHTVCEWIETLPYAKELIVGESKE